MFDWSINCIFALPSKNHGAMAIVQSKRKTKILPSLGKKTPIFSFVNFERSEAYIFCSDKNLQNHWKIYLFRIKFLSKIAHAHKNI